MTAFRRVQRNDVIALFYAGHTAPGIHHHAGALVTQDRREQPLGIGAGKREFIGVADAGRFYFNHYLALARAIELHGCDLERLSSGDSNGGANIHKAGSPLPIVC